MDVEERDLWCTLNAFLLDSKLTPSARAQVVDALYREHHHRPPWILRVQHIVVQNGRPRDGKAKRKQRSSRGAGAD